MHISASLLAALALGLGPAWAVPVKEVISTEVDGYPGSIPLEKFQDLEKDLPVLKPRLPKRDPKERPDFSLKKDIALKWDDGEEDVIQAELKASWKEQEEVSVLNLDDFAVAIDKVDCQAPTLSLFFNKDADRYYQDAQKQWDWINGGDGKNSIILFANHPSCDEAGKAGAPFRVTGIKYDDKQLSAYFSVEEIDNLETVIPDGELNVDTLADIDEPIEDAPRDEDDPPQEQEQEQPLDPKKAAALAKRASVSINPTISLQKDFNNKNIFTLGSGSSSLKLDCTTCGSRGKIKIKLYANIKWFKVQESYVEFRAEAVQAFINLKLHGQANRNWRGHKVLIPITAYGFQIPAVATLRLAADIGVGYDATLNGQGQVTWGATASLTNPSIRRECFKGCSDYKSGYVTDFSFPCLHPLTS